MNKKIDLKLLFEIEQSLKNIYNSDKRFNKKSHLYYYIAVCEGIRINEIRNKYDYHFLSQCNKIILAHKRN